MGWEEVKKSTAGGKKSTVGEPIVLPSAVSIDVLTSNAVVVK